MNTEQQIIEAAKKDLTAFRPIYEKYHEPIFRFVYQRVDDKEAAYDITSNVFLKAMNNLAKYESRGFPFSSWLYRIARNACNDAFRANKANRTVKLQTDHIKDFMEQYDPAHDHMQREMINALQDMEAGDLELIEMRFFEQRPFKEIAEILNTTESNAKMKLYRLLERLKKRINTQKNG